MREEVLPYRQGIVAVFTNAQRSNEFLVGCRRSLSGQLKIWQFPQGGLDAEDYCTNPTNPHIAALYREVEEELSIESTQYTVLRQSTEFTRYNFQPNEWLKLEHADQYRGQQHIWFHCLLHDSVQIEDIALDKVKDPEFCQLKWCNLQEVLDMVAGYKLKAYQNGLKMLELL